MVNTSLMTPAMTPDRREDKLPKWAQDALTSLRQAVIREQERASAGPDNSDTFADPYDAAPVPLGRGRNIQFRPRNSGPISVWVDSWGNLGVSADGQLSVMPRSSNSVRLTTEVR